MQNDTDMPVKVKMIQQHMCSTLYIKSFQQMYTGQEGVPKTYQIGDICHPGGVLLAILIFSIVLFTFWSITKRVWLLAWRLLRNWNFSYYFGSPHPRLENSLSFWSQKVLILVSKDFCLKKSNYHDLWPQKKSAVKGVLKKISVFYSQANRKGGGQPPWPSP